MQASGLLLQVAALNRPGRQSMPRHPHRFLSSHHPKRFFFCVTNLAIITELTLSFVCVCLHPSSSSSSLSATFLTHSLLLFVTAASCCGMIIQQLAKHTTCQEQRIRAAEQRALEQREEENNYLKQIQEEKDRVDQTFDNFVLHLDELYTAKFQFIEENQDPDEAENGGTIITQDERHTIKLD